MDMIITLHWRLWVSLPGYLEDCYYMLSELPDLQNNAYGSLTWFRNRTCVSGALDDKCLPSQSLLELDRLRTISWGQGRNLRFLRGPCRSSADHCSKRLYGVSCNWQLPGKQISKAQKSCAPHVSALTPRGDRSRLKYDQ